MFRYTYNIVCFRRKPIRKSTPKSIANLRQMESLSSQLSSAIDRVKCGNATALATSATLLAIGTGRGMVLLFDIASECLKLSIGGKSTNIGASSAISALAFDRTGRRLLIGYARGHVQLVDVVSGRIMLHIESERAHQAGRGVLHLSFTTRSHTAIIVDSGGSVFELRLHRTISGALTSRLECIFSGCHGEVCAISILSSSSPTTGKSIDASRPYFDANLLAMVTLTKVMVIKLKAPTRMIFACSLVGAPQSPPLVSWQWMPIQV